MPTYSRKTLRRALGQSYLSDVLTGNTALSLGANATVAVLESVQADPSASGHGLYERAWLRVGTGDYRVATFNAPSGAFVTLQLARSAIASGADYEVHARLSPTDKDRALDDVIRRVRVRREVGIAVVDDSHLYAVATLNAAASPYTLHEILDVYYFHSPDGSLGRDRRELTRWQMVTTGSGEELRIQPALAASQQLVVDAILLASLGSGDAATVNIPDDRWVLAGAAAKCYDLMIQNAPGQQVDELQRRRAEWAMEYSRLSARWQPQVDRRIRLGEVSD